MKATNTRIALASLALALTASTASADILYDLVPYAHSIGELKARYSRALSTREADPVAGCKRVVADARAAGMHDTEVLRDDAFQHVRGASYVEMNWQINFRDAGNVCNALAYWRKVAQAEGALSEAQSALDWLGMISKSGTDPANGEALIAKGKACSAAVDAALAAGVAPDVTIEVHGTRTERTVSLATGQTELCAKLSAEGATFAEDAIRETKAAREAAEAPYKAAGVKGDRLDYLVGHENRAMYGVGGVALTDLKQRAKAKVIFEVLTGQGVVTLRRHEFKGDKLVSTTEQDFLLRPGRDAYR